MIASKMAPAKIGMFFGLFLVWLIVVAVRSIGSVADAQVREQAAIPVSFMRSTFVDVFWEKRMKTRRL